MRTRFLHSCSGYDNYASGHRPQFNAEADFRGTIVHPQAGRDDIDYRGKRVNVIGSGATAVKLVPELARRAAHVTMLQRSQSYVVALPAQDAVAKALSKRAVGAAPVVPLTQVELTADFIDALARRA